MVKHVGASSKTDSSTKNTLKPRNISSSESLDGKGIIVYNRDSVLLSFYCPW